MAEHNETGAIGEKLAMEYLIKKGYTVRDNNWRCDRYELDLVCEHAGRIVVVEVKTRTSDYVDPIKAITPAKIMRTVRAANVYMQLFNLPHEVQFDVIIVTFDGSGPRIEHIEDAFFPPMRTYR